MKLISSASHAQVPYAVQHMLFLRNTQNQHRTKIHMSLHIAQYLPLLSH